MTLTVKALKEIALGLENSRDSLRCLRLQFEAPQSFHYTDDILEALGDLLLVPKDLNDLSLQCDMDLNARTKEMFDRLTHITNLQRLRILFRMNCNDPERVQVIGDFVLQNQKLRELEFSLPPDLLTHEFNAITKTVQQLPLLKRFYWDLWMSDTCEVDSIIKMIRNCRVLETFHLPADDDFLKNDLFLMKFFTAIYRSKSIKDFKLAAPFDEIRKRGYDWMRDNLHKLKKFDSISIDIEFKERRYKNIGKSGIFDRLYSIKLLQI